MIEPRLLERIREGAQLLRARGATAVYVFGSVTRGHLREDSDIDLAVTGLPPEIFFKTMAEVARIIGRPVDLVALDRDDAVARSLFASGELQHVA